MTTVLKVFFFRNLALITREMIQTEGDYIRSLRLVIDNYLPEMTKESVPHNLRGKRNIIFGNIEKIYYFHSQVFQEELRNCESNPFTAGRIFMEHAPEFYLYALYNKNKPKCDAILAESGKAFFQAKQLELQDKLDLASYLLKPVQRMAKYALLLKQLLQLCPEHVPEYSDLKAAVEMVKFQLRHGNDLLAMDCLRDCDVNLAEQGMLLRQQDFLVWQGRRKCVRRLFLFEELLVLSKAKLLPSGEEVYQYKSSIKTSELGLTENVGDSGAKFEVWFRKRMSGGTYTMQAPSLEIKRQWVTEMSRLLWKQAIRNRELKKVENHQMGMGGKPGLDLKPSKDNISDRLVSVSLANRGEGFLD
ncbi:hypothetical protein CAPTEDRAFT_104869 [Capitella teleta]|uniref:DH domain-containing protein n=1 Tax=Capitella teleta TaxID=283909 RepID=R7TEE0_CAPTE|nr:hypothetical protein CAPTEDRAFT_104869 [Capitella teleta]|eukprot:ELT89837.1 hypothetical protein CAPTEDRAFT_104869 [Capitella teleta]